MDLLLSFPTGVFFGYGIGMIVVLVQFRVISKRIESHVQIITQLKSQIHELNDTLVIQQGSINEQNRRLNQIKTLATNENPT